MCSACLGTPAVFLLRVMQLTALLRFPSWLTQVGCPTPAVMVSHGVGGCLVTVVLFPPCFYFFCDCASSPSAASPSGFCPLTGWVGRSVSSLLVYSSGWVGGVSLRPLPQGLQRALFSLRVVFWASPAPLACGVRGALHPVSGCSSCGVVYLVCRWGSPAAFSFPWSGWGVSRVCGLRRRSQLSFVVRHPLPVSVGLHHFLELGWFLVTGWWLLLRLLVLDSSDARLHLPDALASASTPISGSWMVQAPAFSCSLPWVRPSRFPCWLLA